MTMSRRDMMLFAVATVGTALTDATSAVGQASDTITLRELGVHGDGSDEGEAFRRALAMIARKSVFSGRHVTLVGDRKGTYHFTGDVRITRPHLTIDMMGALVLANSRFVFRGNLENEPGALENDALLLDDVHFRNARFGNPDDLDAPSRGPIFEFVRNSSLENVVRIGRGGTCFNLHFAKNCVFRNVSVRAARPMGEGGTIGILLLHTQGCTVENFEVTGPGEWVYGVQQKGGSANRWIKGNIHDIVDDIRQGHLYRDRGDNPYDSRSRTGKTYPYPFASGAWNAPDVRRASTDTHWVNLGARNTPDTMPSFATAESKGSQVHGLKVVDARGIAIIRSPAAPAGYDDDYQINDFKGSGVVFPMIAGNTRSGRMKSFRVSRFVVESMRDTALSKRQYGILLEKVSHADLTNVSINAGIASIIGAIKHVDCSGVSYENLSLRGKYIDEPIVEDAATKGTRFLDATSASHSARISVQQDAR